MRISAPIYRFKDRFMKFHNKNGTINWSGLFWWCYLVGTPFWIIGLFVDGGNSIDPFSATWYVLLLVAWMFLILDMLSMRRNHKLWNALWKEEIEIMRSGDWYQDKKKMKRLEELRKEMDKL